MVFRKAFVLGHFPSEAYAAVAASQGFSLVVNGKDARPMMSDGQRNGRIAIYDLRADLVAGQNTIAIDVTSHTEKKLNDVERLQFPKSRNHLNTVSGVGFYLHADLGDNGVVELTTDSSWLVHRAPEGKWKEPKYDDKSWAMAIELPDGHRAGGRRAGAAADRAQGFCQRGDRNRADNAKRLHDRGPAGRDSRIATRIGCTDDGARSPESRAGDDHAIDRIHNATGAGVDQRHCVGSRCKREARLNVAASSEDPPACG